MPCKSFIVTLLSDVSITADAATVGGHSGLDYLPGSLFLGAAAAEARRRGIPFSPDLFLSGKVRFLDALPLIDGERGFAIPLCYHRKKGESWEGKESVNLLSDLPDGQAKQWRRGYMNTRGEVLEIGLESRMKTAIDRNFRRSKESQLFGYESIPEGTRFLMSVQADDDKKLEEAVSYLSRDTLRLGRSRSAEYGAVRIEEAPLPGETVQSEDTSEDIIYIQLMSDTALEENGIGRPSTYATTLKTIVDRGYVVKESKTFKPTELGVVVTLKIFKDHFPKIVNVKFTASMESALDEVEQGKLPMEKMLSDFYFDLDTTLKKAKVDLKDTKFRLGEDITDELCEKCGRKMVKMTGRYGPFLACEGYPECKNSKPLILKTRARCPKCGANVVERRVRNRTSSIFYGCEKWPDCDFATWNTPTGEDCPQCGKSLFVDRRGNISCESESCNYKAKASRKSKSDSLAKTESNPEVNDEE